MSQAKQKKRSYDLSDFALDDTVPLHEAAPGVIDEPADPGQGIPTPPAAPQPAVQPAPRLQAAPPSEPAAPAPMMPAALPSVVPPGRAGRVPATFWISMDLRRAMRQAMVGRLEGVYRSQGDLVEAAVRRFLNLG